MDRCALTFLCCANVKIVNESSSDNSVRVRCERGAVVAGVTVANDRLTVVDGARRAGDVACA